MVERFFLVREVVLVFLVCEFVFVVCDGVDVLSSVVRRSSNSSIFGLTLVSHVSHLTALVASDAILFSVVVLAKVLLIILMLGWSLLPVIPKMRLFIHSLSVPIVELSLKGLEFLCEVIQFVLVVSF